MSLPYHEYVEIEMVCDIAWGYPAINPVVDAMAGGIVGYKPGRVQQDEHFMYRGALACAPRTWAHAADPKDQKRINKAQAEKQADKQATARKRLLIQAQLDAGMMTPELVALLESGESDDRFVPPHKTNKPTAADPMIGLRAKAKELGIKRGGNMGEERLKAEIVQAQKALNPGPTPAEKDEASKERASDAVAGAV